MGNPRKSSSATSFIDLTSTTTGTSDNAPDILEDVDSYQETSLMHLLPNKVKSSKVPPQPPKRSASFDMAEPESVMPHLMPGSSIPLSVSEQPLALSPPQPFADNQGHNNQHQHYGTLQAGRAASHHNSHSDNRSKSKAGCDSRRQCLTLLRKTTSEGKSILPPPPQYKGVHFAPQTVIPEELDTVPIPTEGLPKGPASKKSKVESHPVTVIETVPIKVKKSNPAPVVLPKPSGPRMHGSSSMTFAGGKGVKEEKISKTEVQGAKANSEAVQS